MSFNLGISSNAIFGEEFFVKKHVCDDRFIEMVQLMGMEKANKAEDFITALKNLQEACGVADLKMSGYGIKPEEFAAMVRNAHETLGVNFLNDSCDLSEEDCMEIYNVEKKG